MRGDAVPADALARVDADLFCARAVDQGMLPLVADRLTGRTGVPARLLALLRKRADEAVATDLVREAELKELVAALDAAAVPAVFMKGSHLAYSHYPRPDLRPRIDTDVLIAADARARVDALLARRGYERSSKVTGELVTGQSFYVKRRDGVVVHALDVHWKVSTPLVFANVLSYDELMAGAVALPRLGGTARGPSDVHALLIACVHRVAHHQDSVVRLKWLYDVDLIARGLDDGGWKAFVALAVERKVAAVCRRSLERATEWFRTRVPEHVARELRIADAGAREVTAGYLTARPQAGALVDDLRTLGTWRQRGRLVRENLFPPADYMRRVYAPSSTMPLPALYVWRFLRGATKWLTR